MMDLSKIIEILTPEELLVEYEVRGLTATQEGVALKFMKNIQKELQGEISKPKWSHIKENPEVELKAIHKKILEIDESVETLESSNSVSEKQRFLFRTIHWRDRAERLIASFPKLPEIALICSSLNRLVRSASRDLKKLEDDIQQQHKRFDTTKPSIGSRPVDHGIRRQHVNKGAIPKYSEPKPIEDERRFSKKLEDITTAFLEKLQTLDSAEKTGKSRSKTGGSSNYESSDEKCDDTCVSDSSSEHYSRSRKSKEQQNSNSHYKRRPNPSKWKVSFSGVRDGRKGDDNVQDFLMRLEENAYQDGVPKQELVNLMRNFVTDKAEKWYYIYVRKHKQATWTRLKNALLDRFGSVEDERAIRRYIRHRVQYSKESFSDFVLKLETVNCRLSKPLSDEEILEALLDNMNPALKNATATMRFDSIESLRKVCNNFEHLWSSSGYDARKLIETRPRRNPLVDELSKYDYSTQFTTKFTRKQ